MNHQRISRGLLASTALLGALAAWPALAQTAPAAATAPVATAPANPPKVTGSTGLEEVVVTATRQTNTVNRVALSVAAVTQKTLDQQGIKSAQDITRVVPGLNVTGPAAAANGSTNTTFSIRGVVATVGAATTGVYLDDVSLSKRANTGVSQQNGAPLPVLFDLDRVEVLKGPQGTLYGGSSEGGAIRFITPAPSLTTMSGLARVEVNQVDQGGVGYEFGAATGGPIVQDKLGFRISGVYRRTAGWIDSYSAYDNTLLAKDGNGRTEYEINPQILWQVNDRFSIKASYYKSHATTDGGAGTVTDIYTTNGVKAPANQTFTTPTVCNTTVRPATLPIAAPGGQGATAFAVPMTFGCSPIEPAGIHFRPSVTYGPFKTGQDVGLIITGQGRVHNGSINDLGVGGLTLNYRTDWFTATSITSLINDRSFLGNQGGFEDPNTQSRTVEDGAAHIGFPLFAFAKPGGLVGDYNGGFTGVNARQQVAQEIRLTSPAEQRPLTWVAGFYYADSKTGVGYTYPGDGSPQLLAYYGIDAFAKYGITNVNGLMARLDADIDDKEIAGYADVNLWVLHNLKLEAGVRYAQDTFNYKQYNYGQFGGRFPDNPTALTQGVAKSSPLAPKFGIEYQFAPDRIVYATAAKGFRAGGVNPQVAQSTCDAGLTALGITANQIPTSYGPDEVWSYEIGEKFRLMDNRLQLNTAVYQIDWSGVQATIPISCGFNFVMNGGRAQSRGVDLQTSYRPIQPLTVTLNAGYTDAKYLDPVAGPNPAVLVAPSINAGDGFGIPKLQISSSAQYEWPKIWGQWDGYGRADYQWQDAYVQGTSYGTAGYNPFTRFVQAQQQLALRVGFQKDKVEFDVFATNVTDARSQIGNAGNGKTLCSTAAATTSPACTTYTQDNPFVSAVYQKPRVVGVQANYRF
jgi:iron complex outermembrane receptor protein